MIKNIPINADKPRIELKNFFFIIKLIENKTPFALAGRSKKYPKNPDFGADLDLTLSIYPPPAINASEERFILTIFFEKFIFFSFTHFQLIFKDLENA